MAVNFGSLYTSCACNRSPHCLDWGSNGLIAYGACNAVVLFQYQVDGQGNVVQTLIAHKKLVRSVQWIHKEGDENELISTSADNSAIIWTRCDAWSFSHQVLVGHTNVVNIASALYLLNGDLLIATASADSTVKLWKREKETITCNQTISFGNGFALDLKFIILDKVSDQEIPLLIIAGDDSKIHLYAPNEAGSFISLTSLCGHEDWIRSIDCKQDEDGDTWLASASQDNFIRVWKISSQDEDNDTEDSDSGSDSILLDLKLKKNVFEVSEGKKYCVNLESVLSAHENWIYSVKWKKQLYDQRTMQLNIKNDSHQLLSASMDKTMIIWEFEPNLNLWLEKVRFGEVGGNTLGFYGAVFSPNELTALAHGYQGAIHLWNFNKELNTWQPGITFGGHFDSVQDVSWDPEGTYLLSCSHDQTTRLYAPVTKDGKKEHWHEIARPQVHGYDMVCLSMVSKYEFVSGGDEKILRVFKAPRSFAENLQNICGIDASSYLKDTLPEGASVPTLGLSNKAVFEDDLKKSIEEKETKHVKDIYPDFYFTPLTLTEPPTEEVLLQNTLWPEVQKLYGHPYEVFAVACNHQGTIVASSCKASKMEHAAIILWNTATWKQIAQLLFHTLTVTQLEFSPNDQYLLSVSRDRMWAVYESVPEKTPPYEKVAHYDKKLGVHARIIWSGSWSHDSVYFATASRDKKVAIWGKESKAMDKSSFCLSSPALEVEDSATAIAFAPCMLENKRYMLAAGFENGRILICSWKLSELKNESWTLCCTIDKNYAHHLSVNRLKFAPIKRDTEMPSTVLLASCGSDTFVRIHSIPVSSVFG